MTPPKRRAAVIRNRDHVAIMIDVATDEAFRVPLVVRSASTLVLEPDPAARRPEVGATLLVATPEHEWVLGVVTPEPGNLLTLRVVPPVATPDFA